MPDGSVPEWATVLPQTKVYLKPETKVDSKENETICEVSIEAAKDGGSTYMRRKLKLRSTTPNPCMPEVPAAIPEAKLGLFIPSIVEPMRKGNKPVWIILDQSSKGVPLPWFFH